MSKGSGLLVFLLFAAAVFIVGIGLIKITISSAQLTLDYVCGTKDFYLAEAGVEKAKLEISKDPDWHTDWPHLPEDDLTWIIKDAQGLILPLGGGYFKIVKEQGKPRFYAVGIFGKALSVIKINYIWPFKVEGWKKL